MDSDDVIVWLIMTAIVSVIFGLLFAVALWLEAESCEVKSESFDDHKYSFIGGCMVKKGDKWLPLENVRDID